MSADSDQAIPNADQQEKFQLSTEDESGQQVSVAVPQYAQINQAMSDPNNPYSPLATPRDMVDAMNRGENVQLRFDSYQNDTEIIEAVGLRSVLSEANKAINNGDVNAYNIAARELTDSGILMPEVEDASEFSELSAMQRRAFSDIEKRKMKP